MSSTSVSTSGSCCRRPVCSCRRCLIARAPRVPGASPWQHAYCPATTYARTHAYASSHSLFHSTTFLPSQLVQHPFSFVWHEVQVYLSLLAYRLSTLAFSFKNGTKDLCQPRGRGGRVSSALSERYSTFSAFWSVSKLIISPLALQNLKGRKRCWCPKLTCCLSIEKRRMKVRTMTRNCQKSSRKPLNTLSDSASTRIESRSQLWEGESTSLSSTMQGHARTSRWECIYKLRMFTVCTFLCQAESSNVVVDQNSDDRIQ